MSLLLAIESSSNVYRIVLGRDGMSLFDSAKDHCDPSLRTLGSLLSCGLEIVGAQADAIAGIAINIGPGSLTFVRAGISFANALAFSLGINIYPFNWFEIIARQTKDTISLPIVCAVPAANENAYLGLIRQASVEIMRFGLLRATLVEVTRGLSEVAVAGRIRHQLSSLLCAQKAADTGIEVPDARVLLSLGFQCLIDGSRSTNQVEALNDQSTLFYE